MQIKELRCSLYRIYLISLLFYNDYHIKEFAVCPDITNQKIVQHWLEYQLGPEAL
jgi:hypothetical protein